MGREARDLDLMAHKSKLSKLPIIGDYFSSRPDISGKKFFEELSRKGINIQTKNKMTTNDLWKLDPKNNPADKKALKLITDQLEISKTGKKILKQFNLTKNDIKAHEIEARLRELFSDTAIYTKPLRNPTDYMAKEKYGDALIKLFKNNKDLILFGKRSENLYRTKPLKTTDWDSQLISKDATKTAKQAEKIFQELGYKVKAEKIVYKDKITGKIMQARNSWRLIDTKTGEHILDMTPRKFNVRITILQQTE